MTQETISFTKVKLPFGWLGNMSPFPVEANGVTWRTTEALFQALRFADRGIREEIRAEKSPMAAKLKAKGKRDQMVIEPLSVQDVQNMKYCIILKVKQHEEIRKQLLDTGDARIIEDVTSRGRRGSNLFWGALKTDDGEWEGLNTLGILWMEVRETVRSELAVSTD